MEISRSYDFVNHSYGYLQTACDSLILALLIIFFCIFPFFSFFSSFISFTEQVFKTIMNANTYKFNSDISKEALKPSTLH